MAEKKSNFLSAHLRRKGDHLGRSNPEMQRLADATGLSIHTIQSMAMCRRTICDETKRLLRDAIDNG